MTHASERLDYEDSGKWYTDKVERRINDVFSSHKGRHWVHETKIKPRLEIAEGNLLVEIGVGLGNHLGSYRGLNYLGYDVNERLLTYARRAAEFHKIDPKNIRRTTDGAIPVQTQSIDGLFAVATLHEVEDLEAELIEIDRVMKPSGRVVIVERMCAINEPQEHITRLKETPAFLPGWFARRDYATQENRFMASYFGEYPNASPLFRFYLLAAQKPL